MNEITTLWLLNINLAHGGQTIAPSGYAYTADVTPGSAAEVLIAEGLMEALPQADGSLFLGVTAKGCRLVNEADARS